MANWDALNWAWNQPVRSSRKVILAYLASSSNEDGYSFPGHLRISEMTSLTERAVISNIKWLESMGMVEVEARYRRGRRTSNRYRLRMDRGVPLDVIQERAAAKRRGEDVKPLTESDIETAVARYLRSKDDGFGVNEVHPSAVDNSAGSRSRGERGSPLNETGGESGAPPGVNEVHPNRSDYLDTKTNDHGNVSGDAVDNSEHGEESEQGGTGANQAGGATIQWADLETVFAEFNRRFGSDWNGGAEVYLNVWMERLEDVSQKLLFLALEYCTHKDRRHGPTLDEFAGICERIRPGASADELDTYTPDVGDAYVAKCRQIIEQGKASGGD